MVCLSVRWAAVTAMFLVQACSAMSTTRDAEVVLKDGRLCFSAAKKDQSSSDGVQLQALSVSGPRGSQGYDGKPPLMWAFRIAKGQAPLVLRGATCISYGALPPQSEQTVAPQNLQANAVYSVFLNGRRSSEDSVLGYRAEFCMLPNGEGKMESLMLVPWDEKAQKWRYDSCTSQTVK